MKRRLTLLAASLFGASLVACPGAKFPSGPPPEYEDPPPPSWLDGGATAPATPSAPIPDAPADVPAPDADAGPPPS